MSRLRALAPMPAVLLVGNATAAPSSPVAEVTKATTETGRIFQSGGIDGLVLFALILGTFLMFLVAIGAVWWGHRSSTKKTELTNAAFEAKDKQMEALTNSFIASMDRTAAAVSALSVSVANDLQERAATGAVLARIEGTDQRMIALLEQLNDRR